MVPGVAGSSPVFRPFNTILPMKNLIYLLPFSVLAACSNGTNNESTANEITIEKTLAVDTTAIAFGQEVYFENLEDMQIISSPLTIKMGVKGMEVEPANSGVNKNKGHHHLLIDTLSFISPGTLIPMVDKRIIHFGGGQTEYTVDLSPGKHQISMQFANGLHSSYGIRMSKTVTVEVQ